MTLPQSASATSSAVEIPSNLYKPNDPLAARVLEHRRLTHRDSANEVCHIVLDLSGSNYRYVEGQSVGVVPPGFDANGKPHKLRLYSIASPAVGDDGQGKTVSVCVKRAVAEVDGTRYEGVCSSYLCNATVGQSISLTGPVGKSFLLPQDPNANLVMVATGTGIAPFRAFLKKRYAAGQPACTGQTWLFFGAQTQKDFLYQDELPQYQQDPNFHCITAFSREENNAQGGRMYVQHRIQENAERLVALLKQPSTTFYMCGLRGMEDGIIEGLSQACAATGTVWEELFATLKAEHRWHVEVY